MAIPQKLMDFKEEVFNNPNLPAKELLGYCAGIAGNTMGQDSTTSFSDKFERDFMGIKNEKLHLKGNILTIGSFIFPPIAGTWYDSASHGKRSNLRTALMLMPVPFALSSLMLFFVPSHSELTNYIWTFIAGMIFSISDTFYDIAMSALGLKLCEDPRTRKSFFTISSLAASLGSALPGWLTPMLVDAAKTSSAKKWTYFVMACVFCVIGVASMYMPYFTVGKKIDDSILALEKKKAENTKKNIQWNSETFKAIFHNRPFLILQLSLFSDTIRQITYSSLNFLYEDVLDDFKLKGFMEMISGTLAYFGLLAVPVVGDKISARNILSGGYAYTGFFYLLMSLFNIKFNLENLRKKRLIVGLLIGFAGMPNYAQSTARKIITADSTDYMEWYSCKNYGTPVRSDGILSATGNIIGKITALVKTNLYYTLLGRTGYKSADLNSDEKVIQTDETLQKIFAMISLCGLIGNILSAIIFQFDNFTGKRRDAILEELNEFRQQRAEVQEVSE